MSKITFRADEDLVERLEALDASKSEVMREALRAYLDDAERHERGQSPSSSQETATIDDALTARIDDLIAERLEESLDSLGSLDRLARRTNDVNVNVTLDGVASRDSATQPTTESTDGVRKTNASRSNDGGGRGTDHCDQCGETVDDSHVYCPNCGEKASHRVFCDCGDEVRSDWAFCPSCGRRTPAADVLDHT